MCGCVLDSDSSGCVTGVGPYDHKLLISVKAVECFDYANDKSFVNGHYSMEIIT
jgi:hypothetical protein